MKKELGWKQSFRFDEELRDMISWYLKNGEWISSITSGEYMKWIETNYHIRGK